MDLSPGLQGMTTEFVRFFSQSLVIRSIVTEFKNIEIVLLMTFSDRAIIS